MQNLYYRDLIIESLTEQALTTSSMKTYEDIFEEMSKEILSNDRSFTIMAVAARVDAQVTFNVETGIPSIGGGRDIVLLTLRSYENGRTIESTPALFKGHETNLKSNGTNGPNANKIHVGNSDNIEGSFKRTFSLPGGSLYEYTVEISSESNEKETRISRIIMNREIAKSLQVRSRLIKPLCAKPPVSRRVSRYVFHGSLVEFDEFNYSNLKSRLPICGVRKILPEGAYQKSKPAIHSDADRELCMESVDVFDELQKEHDATKYNWAETFRLLSGRKLSVNVAYRIVLPDDPSWQVTDPSSAIESGGAGINQNSVFDSLEDTEMNASWKGTEWTTQLHGHPPIASSTGHDGADSSQMDLTAGPRTLLTGMSFSNFAMVDCVHGFGDPFSFEAWSVDLDDGILPFGPRIVVEVTSRDGWDRTRLVGVGTAAINLTPGRQIIEIKLSRPYLSLSDSFRERYIGGVNTLTDFNLAAHSADGGRNPSNRSSLHQVTQPGVVRFSIHTMVQTQVPARLGRSDELSISKPTPKRSASLKPKRPSPARGQRMMPNAPRSGRSTSPRAGRSRSRPRGAPERFTNTHDVISSNVIDEARRERTTDFIRRRQ